MFANYHSHTFRCGHACGTEREYIEAAIAGGLKILGFSDHAPFIFPDGFESGFRQKMNTVTDYFETLNTLREEYKDRIKILIGYEMEYYPLYFDTMLNNVREYGAEYLILGQHFIGNEHPGGKYCGSVNENEEGFAEYTDCVIAGMKTGKFIYVAHPDVYHFVGDPAVRAREWRRICKASAETGIPLEINFLGIRDNRHYPADDFWMIAAEENAPVIFGFDAHDPQSAWDAESLVKAEEAVRVLGLRVVDEIKIPEAL